MYWRAFLVFISLFFTACVTKQEALSTIQIKQDSFNTELLKGFAYENSGDFQRASAVFLDLFKQYKEASLLEKAFLLAMLSNADKNTLDELNEAAKEYDLANLTRLRISYYVKFQDMQNALALLEELMKKDKDFKNYELAGDLYLFTKNLQKALAFYKKARAFLPDSLKPSESLSVKISELEFLSNDIRASKKTLEDFIKENKDKCTMLVCSRLAILYANEKNLKGFRDTSLQLYELSSNPQFLVSVISFYYELGKKDFIYKDLYAYLENDPLPLYYIFRVMKDYETANIFANRLYKQTKNKDFLSASAIMDYENMLEKNTLDEQNLRLVVQKFDKSVNQNSKAHILNFYGYLLIDHDIDIKKGINLVNLALKEEPKNVYYLDSLAWGYYKQGKCKDALTLMQEALKYDEKGQMANSDEYKEHIRAINSCLGLR